MVAMFAGLAAGLSLIMAIGAQNAFVIRQGLSKNHVLVVVLICAISDIALIAAGVAGLGVVIHSLPWLLEIIRWAGVAYLLWFAYKSIRAAFGTETLDAAGAKASSLKSVVSTVLAMTFLNPHVYLDTVIFLGAIANQFSTERWLFAFGAMAASVIWFFALGFGASAASRFMSKPIFWRVLDSIIAVVMIALAVMLAVLKFD